MPKITQTYGKEAYEFRGNSIVVTIPFNWINVMADKVGNKGSDKVGDKDIELFLNHTQTRILAEIRNNPNITKSCLAETLQLGKTTIDKGIAVLKKYDILKV